MARVFPIDPGERDRAVTIQQRDATDDVGTGGEPIETWTTLVSNVFMRQIPVSGSERFKAQQMGAEYSTRWEMPYRPDMDPDLVDVPKLRRLSYKGRVYDIVYGALINRQDGIELATIASGRDA